MAGDATGDATGDALARINISNLLYTVKNNFQRANDNFAYIKFMLLLVKISMSSTILVLESDLMQGKIPKQMQV